MASHFGRPLSSVDDPPKGAGSGWERERERARARDEDRERPCGAINAGMFWYLDGLMKCEGARDPDSRSWFVGSCCEMCVLVLRLQIHCDSPSDLKIPLEILLLRVVGPYIDYRNMLVGCRRNDEKTHGQEEAYKRATERRSSQQPRNRAEWWGGAVWTCAHL